VRYDANCSMLFTELPLLDRPKAAREAGFTAVEFWWPFETAAPSDKIVDEFITAIDEAGVRLVGLNFFAGDLAGADCGLASVPSRSAEFRDSVDIAVAIGARLGVTGFNALYGNRADDLSAQEQDELAFENLIFAAERAATVDAIVLIEPISGPKPYPLRSASDVMAVVTRLGDAGATNVSMLLDIYHLATNDTDVDKAIEVYAGDIGHVQVADAPGRGEPGSGQLDIAGYLHHLVERGYEGWVGLEYRPTRPTVDSLAWLPLEHRGGH
jgi:hydroxypyruvate isomerase